jgi:hypothetical protein
MELIMFLGNTPIDRIPIDAKKISSPGHIAHLKMEMQQRNEDIIDTSTEEPQFFIENVPSSMNARKHLYNN